MNKKTLAQLYAEHTGKVSDKWALYLTEYDRLFGDCRDDPISLLEIGIQNGGSLEIWSQYFSNAKHLIGCDINPDCSNLLYDDTRISVIVGDANAPDICAQVFNKSSGFDIVIDDGSHLSGDIIKSFALYFTKVKAGGIYVAEDLHCSYWDQFEGGLFDPYSSISFFKRLSDVINHEHWGVPKTRLDLLRGISMRYHVDFDEESLAQVHSVEFVNSMCIVRKARQESNGLSHRFIAGSVEQVIPGHLDMHMRKYELEPIYEQFHNPWSSREIPPEEAIFFVEGALHSAQQQIADLSQAVAERDGQIASLIQVVVERDGQIADLTQAVIDRDSQVSRLDQTVTDRDQQIASLNQALAERDRVVSQILASTSWRITRPLRAIKSSVPKAEGSVSVLEVSPKRFDATWYLARNPDVAMSGMDPYEHYLSFGKAEGRQPAPDPFSLRNTTRARFMRSALLVAVRRGGIKRATKKAWSVFKREGWRGVRRRVIFLYTQATHPAGQSAGFSRNDYAEWIRRYDTITDDTRAIMRARIDTFSRKPHISVLMPCYNPRPEWVSEAIESVRQQIYPHWELCIADDASSDKAIRPILERYARGDSRIKVAFREHNGHISQASNSALDLATGEWIALLDHDDLLSEHALFWVAEAINKNPDLGLIYSDEDKTDEIGRRFDPYFKCDWNVDLLYSHNMITHLGVYRTDLLRDIGGFRAGLEGAQDYDLALRCIERIEARQIHHIPRVLYHWRMHADSTAQSADAKPYAMLAGERALNRHFKRLKISAEAEFIGHGYRVRYALPASPPLVSLIIPTRNGLQLLRQCVESVLRKSTYPNYEILIVDNGSDDPATLQYLEDMQADARVRVLRDERPFNFSALNNAAAKLARGEVLGLFNNDLETLSPDWLSEMVSHAIRPGVGAVGARLWYPNETLQHAGVILGIGGIAGHSHKNLLRHQHGYFCRAALTQSLSAVSAACLVIRKAIYEEVGGLNETDLQVAFNDVDFCLRVREAGYRNIWTPYAELYHHESATRGFEDTPEKQARFAKEVAYMKQRWGDQLLYDPAYSPNLTLEHEDFSLAWPPRVKQL